MNERTKGQTNKVPFYYPRLRGTMFTSIFKYLKGLPLWQVGICCHQLGVQKTNTPCPISSCHLHWSPTSRRSWEQGGDSQWSSHIPTKAPLSGDGGGQAEGKPRQEQEEAGCSCPLRLWLGWHRLCYPSRQTYLLSSTQWLGESLSFSIQWPGSYYNYKYFLQLTFLATLKLFQRVT